jgi:hypothetical protein
MNLTYERNIKLLDTLESRERLRSILADPVFLAAMAVVQEDCRVRQPDLDKYPDLVVTRRTAYHSGVSEVAEKLRRLSRKDNSNDIAKDEEEPFDYLNNTEQ